MERINLDHGSIKPVDERVHSYMIETLKEGIGNPSSLHEDGRRGKTLIEDARSKVARLIGGEAKGVIFTSGATEANNMALIGMAQRAKKAGGKVLISAIEHMSIINPSKHISKMGFEVVRIPVDSDGMLDMGAFEKEISKDTALVSFMYANGEIGTIQPISEIGKITSEMRVPFHVDAASCCGSIPIDVKASNIDLLSLSSNSLYGPMGVGALYMRPGIRVSPIVLGGGQEFGMRSGTENIPGIVGMGKAAELAGQEMEKDAQRLSGLRDQLIEGVLGKIEHSYLTGHRKKRLPDHASLRFSFIEGESLLLNMDMEGISVSTGSACTSKTLEPSHVLLAMGLKHEEVHGSLVFTFGRESKERDVEHVLEVLPGIVDKLRALSPLGPGKSF